MPDYKYETLLVEQDESVLTITLNRPDKLNAYTTEMGDEAYDAFDRCRQDDMIESQLGEHIASARRSRGKDEAGRHSRSSMRVTGP